MRALSFDLPRYRSRRPRLQKCDNLEIAWLLTPDGSELRRPVSSRNVGADIALERSEQMPKYPTGKLGREQMIVIPRCGGFPGTKRNAIVIFYLFRCRNFRIPGVSIFRNL